MKIIRIYRTVREFGVVAWTYAPLYTIIVCIGGRQSVGRDYVIPDGIELAMSSYGEPMLYRGDEAMELCGDRHPYLASAKGGIDLKLATPEQVATLERIDYDAAYETQCAEASNVPIRP